MTWHAAYSLLRERADCSAQLIREAAALTIAVPFDPRSARSFVTTGVGSSGAAAKLLAHLLGAELGLAARFAHAGAFVTRPNACEGDVLIVFSTGLSPNARLALCDPQAWRSVIVVSAVAAGEPGVNADKLAALDAVRDAGGLAIQLPGGTEYGALLRVAAPIASYVVAWQLAAAIGHAAGRPAARFDTERVCARMQAAAAAGRSAAARGDAFGGRIALLASGGYGELADNLALKIQEGLFLPAPPVWDLIGFAHGPFQEVCEQPLTLFMLQRHAAPLEDDLLARLRSMLDARCHRLLLLPAELPGPLALFEHEALLNELVLHAIEARQIDQGDWPGRERDRPLYEISQPAARAASRSSRSPDDAATASDRVLDAQTWPALGELIESGCRTAVLPLGATEQHGSHLPLSTDSVIAAALGERFCRRVGEAVCLPVLPIGCSSEHADFPGTVSLQPDTLRAVLRDVVASLARHGFETTVIISAHGGNYATLEGALPALRAAAHPMRVCAFTDLERIAAVWHAASAAAGIDAQSAGHHAGEFETSMLLALRPDLVRRGELAAGLLDVGADPQAIFYPNLRRHSPGGVVGDPRRAAAAHGERYLAAWVDALVDWYQREKNAPYTTGTHSA